MTDHKAHVAHLQGYIADLARMKMQADSDQDWFLSHLFQMAATEATEILLKSSRFTIVSREQSGNGQAKPTDRSGC